jgi:ferredoxin
MTFHVMIDESTCLAHGDCEELAPEAFSVEEVARVVGSAPLETLLAAAEACPVGAISVVDDDTGERIDGG